MAGNGHDENSKCYNSNIPLNDFIDNGLDRQNLEQRGLDPSRQEGGGRIEGEEPVNSNNRSTHPVDQTGVNSKVIMQNNQSHVQLPKKDNIDHPL